MNNKKIQEIIPTSGQDIFNYLAGYYASNHQLHMVLTFDGYLNQKKLAEAIRLTMDIDSVLGCKFVEHPKTTYWKRRSDLDVLDFCKVCETDYPNDELKKYIALKTDSRKDPLVQARIFRTEYYDILCIKMDHSCCDGGGLKEYIYLLEEIYKKLCSGQENNITSIVSRRDGIPFLELFGINDPRQAWNPSNKGTPAQWSFPCRNNKNQNPTFILRQLPKEKFLALQEYAKKHSVTINDILVTAYYRALFHICSTNDDTPKPVLVTTDLRRFMPKDYKIVATNFSSSFTTLFSRNDNDTFIDTLQKVKQMMQELKKNHGEVPIAVILELFGFMTFTEVQTWFKNARLQALEKNLETPHLSNMGIINLVTFGELTATEGYIISPAMYSPGFMLGVSTYNKILTLVTNYFTSDIAEKIIHTFLDLMITDLNNCKC